MFTIQMLNPSGDCYLLWWDGDTVTAYAGPLHHTDEDRLHDNPGRAYDWELDDDPDELARLNAASWQYHTFSFIRR